MYTKKDAQMYLKDKRWMCTLKWMRKCTLPSMEKLNVRKEKDAQMYLKDKRWMYT